MKINTALILCAGLGKRLNPLTLTTPKPLLKLNNVTMLENCINMVIKLGIKKILLNTFYLSDQIFEFIKKKNFMADIQIINDGKFILDTGGGVLNMINNSEENDFLILNPDTLWSEEYINEIHKMQNLYFLKKIKNILLITNKALSYDKNFEGDFSLGDNLLNKDGKKDFIYIGCQILNRELIENYELKNFSITKVWDQLLSKNELYGFESSNKFFHLTNLEIFKKLKDL
tara:strand:+ start:611 stop:1300 length:690 start_codon:yes stop_codon:yes gene_type:complete